jgi:hypothetical protein
MLHACVERFDVMGGRGNILGWDGEVNKAILDVDGVFLFGPCLDGKLWRQSLHSKCSVTL